MAEIKATQTLNPWIPPVLLARHLPNSMDQEMLDLVLGRESFVILDCGEREPSSDELRHAVMQRAGPTASKVCEYMRSRVNNRLDECLGSALDGRTSVYARRQLHRAGLPAPHHWRAFLEVTTGLTIARQQWVSQVAAAHRIRVVPRTLSRHSLTCFGTPWREMVKEGWWEWDAERFLRFRKVCPVDAAYSDRSVADEL